MKRFLTLCLMALMMVPVAADPRDKAAAARIANRLLGKSIGEGRLPAALRRRVKAVGATDTPAFYVFNASDGEGFAIVAGDDDMPDVVGQSSTGSFNPAGELPPALADFLEFYAEYVADVRTGRTEAPAPRPRRAANIVATEPLLTCAFGQDAPYNNLCPQDGGTTCPCGCVATAMAQIMHYWQWPTPRIGRKGYDWNHVFPTTAENLASPAASDIVSQICRDAGLAVDMSYTASASGAQSCKVVNALYQTFGYMPTTLRHYYRDTFSSIDEWLALIGRELAAGRPVYYSATSPTGGGRDAAGHAFVVDGCNASGMVHVNWGWDGDVNGYFDIVQLNPTSYAFTDSQAAIVGIRPAYTDVSGKPQDYPRVASAPAYTGNQTFRTTLTFTLNVGNIYNFTANTHSWEFTVGLFDTSLQQIGDINADRFYTSTSLGSFYYLPTPNFNCTLKNVADGDYVLRLVFREVGTTDWMLPDVVGGQETNLIPIRIANKKVTMNAEGVEIITGIDRVQADGDVSGQPLPALLPHLSDTDAPVQVYDAQGRLLHTSKPAAFSISDVPARGLLIVRYGNRTQKLVKN